VDEPTQRVRTHYSESPENQENDGDCPEHGSDLSMST
jgi:hypothetical protein